MTSETFTGQKRDQFQRYKILTRLTDVLWNLLCSCVSM